MKLIQMNWHPSDQHLQQFGLMSLLAFPVIAWFWGASQPVITGLSATGVLLAFTGSLRPQLLRPVFVGLCLVTLPIGFVVSELTLFLMFLLVFLPIGGAFQALRRDALTLQSRAADSYWVMKSQPKSVASYYRQW
jgi:hypothetical protein